MGNKRVVKDVFDNKECPHCKETKEFKRTSKYCSKECRYNSKRKFLDIPDCLESASRKLDKNIGYVRLYCPMHKEANSWGYVYEHRVIAEKMLDRSLKKGEVVHHKSGKRWDNREENLEVLDKVEHAKLHGQRTEDKDI